MVLRFAFKLTLNIIDIDLRVLKIFLEKSFEFKPHNKSNTFVTTLRLRQAGANNALEE